MRLTAGQGIDIRISDCIIAIDSKYISIFVGGNYLQIYPPHTYVILSIDVRRADLGQFGVGDRPSTRHKRTQCGGTGHATAHASPNHPACGSAYQTADTWMHRLHARDGLLGMKWIKNR